MPAKYEILTHRGQQGIKCKKCKMVSFHPKDIENRYCANCAVFYGEYIPTAWDNRFRRIGRWLKEEGLGVAYILIFTMFITVLTVWQARHNNLGMAIALSFINLMNLGYCRECDGRRKMIRAFERANQEMVKEAKELFDRIEKAKRNGWQGDEE